MRSTWSTLATWTSDEFADRPDVLVAMLDVVQAAEMALPEIVESDDPDTVPVAQLGEGERRLRKALRLLREASLKPEAAR